MSPSAPHPPSKEEAGAGGWILPHCEGSSTWPELCKQQALRNCVWLVSYNSPNLETVSLEKAGLPPSSHPQRPGLGM